MQGSGLTLAIEGGTPIRGGRPWPKWPTISRSGLDALGAIEGRPLTIRAAWSPGPTYDQRLTEEFSRLHDCRYGVPVSSGTTAIEVALDALAVGAGDEVIVPALTWVATAIAVLRLNAVPVFVDVEPTTFTLDPNLIDSAVTSRTRAIVPVHWHCAAARMDEIMVIASKHDLLVVEDCAQAHGSRYRGKAVGAWGHAGAFSFHNDKLVSAGEGGIVVTNSNSCWQNAQALRLDGFEWSNEPRPFIDGVYAQGDGGRVMGTSLALSETSCALALDGTLRLREQTSKRETNGERLAALLDGLDGFSPIPRADGLDIRAFYEFAVKVEEPLADIRIETLCKCLAAELGYPVYPEGEAVHVSSLFRPCSRPRYAHAIEALGKQLGISGVAPNAERACETVLMFLHPPLLGDQQDIADIVASFERIATAADRVRELDRGDAAVLRRPLSYWRPAGDSR